MIEIVFVDDDKDILELYSLVFDDDQKIRVHCFDKTSDAINFLNKKKVQYIFCDENLGDSNGLEFLQKLRSMQHHKETKFFLATGSVKIESSKYEKLNCLGIFEKPFEVNEIKDMIKKDQN